VSFGMAIVWMTSSPFGLSGMKANLAGHSERSRGIPWSYP
jgi:hypothetical protein